MARYQRQLVEGTEQRATAIELFFDLVFVFAVTQVSHLLLHDLSWRGAGEATLALLVVWWAWNYTIWVTNELEPDSYVVRLLLIAITLGALLLAVSIPQAFGDRGLLFAGSYVAIQVGRHLFLTIVTAPAGTIERERSARILLWFSVSAVPWLLGGLAHGGTRGLLWTAALMIDYVAPAVLYRVPGLRRLPHDTWQVESAHFSERFQLFVIIALGESVAVTGATAAELELTNARIAALVVAFLSTAALWWLYFDYVARIAQRRLELAIDRTRLARDGFTYLHAAIVAGVIACAVGDAIVIATPVGTLPRAELVAVVAGPTLYLLAHTAFRLRMAGSVSTRRLAGACACAAAGLLGTFASGLVVLASTAAVLGAVIVSERIAAAARAARGDLSPLQRLG